MPPFTGKTLGFIGSHYEPEMNPGDLVVYEHEIFKGDKERLLCIFMGYTARQEIVRAKNYTPCMILSPTQGMKHVLADKLRKIE